MDLCLAWAVRRSNCNNGTAKTDCPFKDPKHTDQEHDSETGLDHFLYRQYSPMQGRWMTPDPAGMAAVDSTNPQSWNRYAYVMNNPLNFIDLVGLECYASDQFGNCTNWGDADGSNLALQGGFGDSFQVVYMTTEVSAEMFGKITSTTITHYLGDMVLASYYEIFTIPDSMMVDPPSAQSSPPPTKAHCLGQAVKKNEVALSLDAAGVAAGFLPGGDAVVAAAGIAISTTGAVYSGFHKDAAGVTLNTAAFGVSALTPTAKAIGGDIAKAVPVLGVFISGIGGLEDSLHVYQDYQACMAGAQ